MTTIPQKQLRNEVGDVLRRAEGGEEFMITVAGRPVAQLGPAHRDAWVPLSQLRDIWTLPADPDLTVDVAAFDYELQDPWR